MNLIARYIEENPQRPGPAHARLIGSGVEIWALVGYYQDAAEGDLERVARDYDIQPEEIEAALAYYRRNKRLIDAQIAQNAA